MTYISKIHDPAGRFVCSKGFAEKQAALDHAKEASLFGSMCYVMNGRIVGVFKAGKLQEK